MIRIIDAFFCYVLVPMVNGLVSVFKLSDRFLCKSLGHKEGISANPPYFYECEYCGKPL